MFKRTEFFFFLASCFFRLIFFSRVTTSSQYTGYFRIDNFQIHRMEYATEKKSVDKARNKAMKSDGPSQSCGTRFTDRQAGSSIASAKYWMKRSKDPNFRASGHGGNRRSFKIEKTSEVVVAIQELLNRRGSVRVKDMCDYVLLQTGHRVSPAYVKCLLATSGITYGAIFSFLTMAVQTVDCILTRLYLIVAKFPGKADQ